MNRDKTTSLYLLRHGQTEDNVRRIIQGHKDSPLTREGITATSVRAKKRKGGAFDAIFCIDLGRARKSLEILLEELDSNIEVNYRAEIRELDFGRITGKNIEEVKKVILLHKKQTWKHYPDGESGDSFSKRVLSFVEMTLGRHVGGTILYMTHFGVIETIVKHYVKKLEDGLTKKNYDMVALYINKKSVSYKWI